MSCESFDVVKFDPYPSFKVKLGSSIFKRLITRLILVLEVSNVKATNRKSCPANLLMESHLNFDPSLKVKLGSSIFKGPITRLILVLDKGVNDIPLYRYFVRFGCIKRNPLRKLKNRISKMSIIFPILVDDISLKQ